MITLLSLALLAVTFFGLGRLCLMRVRFARPSETFVFASALGMAVLAYLAMALGAVGWMTPLGVAVMFGAACGVSFPVTALFLARLRWRRPRLEPVGAVCLVLIVGATLLNLAVTLNPILEVDSWEYHLPVPKAWLLEGRLFAIPYFFQSNYHFLTEMLNVVVFAISPNDVILAKLIQWYSGVLLAIGVWCFGRSFFSARVAWVAAAITYMNKEIVWISATAYIDVTAGLYVWLGIFAMARALALRRLAWHIMAGLFLGCGYAAKQPGAMYAALAYGAAGAVLLLDAQRRRDLGRWLQGALAAGLVAVAVASPWLVKNRLFTGDPFYPFLVRWFDVPPEHAATAAGFTDYYGGLTRYAFWDRETLAQLGRAFENFRTNVMYSGANILVVYLLVSALVLILLGRRLSLALRLLIAIGLLAAPWFAWVTSRFLFGFFPVYALVLLQTLRLATGRRRWLYMLLACVLLYFYGRTFVDYNSYNRYAKSLETTGGVILSRQAQDSWRRAKDPTHAVVRRVNELLTRNDRLLACGSFPSLPRIDAPFLPNPHSFTKPLPLLLWERFGEPEAMRRWLGAHRITHILLQESAAAELENASAFVSRHLELVFAEGGHILFRLKANPD